MKLLQRFPFFAALSMAARRWLVLSLGLMALQWVFIALAPRSGIGVILPGLFLFLGMPVFILIEAAFPWHDNSRPRDTRESRLSLYVNGLLASVLSYGAAIGVLLLMNEGGLQHPTLFRLQMLLLLPVLAAALVLVYGFVLAWPLHRIGCNWGYVWRLATRVKLTSFALVALSFVVLGNYELLSVPQVPPDRFGLPKDQVVYFLSPDGETAHKLDFADPLTVIAVQRPLDPRVTQQRGCLPERLGDYSTSNCSGAPFGEPKFHDGLDGPNGVILGLSTLGSQMSFRHLYALNDHMVLFELNGREIVVYDARLRRLTVLAKGSWPIVAAKEPASSVSAQ